MSRCFLNHLFRSLRLKNASCYLQYNDHNFNVPLHPFSVISTYHGALFRARNCTIVMHPRPSLQLGLKTRRAIFTHNSCIQMFCIPSILPIPVSAHGQFAIDWWIIYPGSAAMLNITVVVGPLWNTYMSWCMYVVRIMYFSSSVHGLYESICILSLFDAPLLCSVATLCSES